MMVSTEPPDCKRWVAPERRSECVVAEQSKPRASKSRFNQRLSLEKDSRNAGPPDASPGLFA
eukprot:11187286-Lingulodinium_polyedra.AAC.1